MEVRGRGAAGELAGELGVGSRVGLRTPISLLERLHVVLTSIPAAFFTHRRVGLGDQRTQPHAVLSLVTHPAPPPSRLFVYP